MIIKVCGMREPENIRQLASLDLDWMGFIFYEKSPRYVELTDVQARAIQNCNCKKVGVFVNASKDEIIEKAKYLKLNFVQLHGDESPAFCESIKTAGFEIIKAFQIATVADLEQTKMYEKVVDYFLFDTKNENYGGSGLRFDWTVLAAYQGNIPFLLSGGIRNESRDAIMNFKHQKFAGIDVNSGFEISPGIKNIALLHDFINEIRLEKSH